MVSENIIIIMGIINNKLLDKFSLTFEVTSEDEYIYTFKKLNILFSKYIKNATNNAKIK